MFHRVVLPLEAGFPHLTLLGYLTLSIVSPLALSSQTINSWTNTGSGNWEDLRWSLGQRPASGQSIMLTNSGWKAVAIGSGTVQNFPQTLNPSSITLGAYTDSFNVLLLNFAGFQTPLSVSQLIINSNSAVTALSSALTVNNGMGGAFSIGGAFNHGDFSVVSAANLNIGDIGPGTYNLTNGTLLVTATQTIARASSRVNQFGGTNYPANLALSPGGEYDIVGGSVAASNLIYRSGGNFRQQGGVVRADKAYLNLGAYYLSAGSFSSGDVEVPGTQSNYDYAGGASFIQTGGSNNTVYLSIGNWRPPLINASSSGDYNLSTGILVTATTSLGPYGGFVQSGGTHNAGAVGMFGDI